MEISEYLKIDVVPLNYEPQVSLVSFSQDSVLGFSGPSFEEMFTIFH